MPRQQKSTPDPSANSPVHSKAREKTVAVYALVKGRVQGVGFRYSTIEKADELGLTGWVRNTRDGSVEVWAEGPQEEIDFFLAWLRRGPQLSRVDSVKTEKIEPKGYTGFNVIY